jgi:hypothetical protein
MVSRLAKCIGAPGGITAALALDRAEKQLAEMAPRAAVHVNTTLMKLRDLVDRWECEPEQTIALCLAILELHAAAGFFGRPELAQAAKLMVETVEGLAPTARLSRRLLRLYLDALRSLAQADGAQKEVSAALLSHLHMLSFRALSGASNI